MFFNRHPQLLAVITAIGVLLLSPVHDGSSGASMPLASHLTHPQAAAASPSNALLQNDLTQNAPAQSAPLQVIDRHRQPVTQIIDGNQVRLRAQLANRSARSQVVRFAIAENSTIATCSIPAGRRRCITAPLSTRGWYWLEGEPSPQRRLDAFVQDVSVASVTVAVAPRPVVLVHGFLASAEGAWSAYKGESGFLSPLGLTGYAVGDGQVEGKLSVGDPRSPQQTTNTIAENAQELSRYLTGVKRLTGAEEVDLVAHSMGGLISRYYIDRLMKGRDVAQLLMVASPHGGSHCANLPASLGFFLPATLELRPAYMQQIFNRQITRRHGVPFYLFAGNPIVQSFKAPCTGVPSDMVVERSSVATLGSPQLELPYIHTAMNRSDQVFQEFVAPLLKQGPNAFPLAADPPPEPAATGSLQFTKLFTGHVEPGQPKALTIQLNDLTVASFSMFDPTRSLSVEVRGATGNVIPLNFDDHGLVQVDDPSSLIYLGYGFQNPRPGAWNVTVLPTDRTPPEGADFAIAAKVLGSATLQAEATPIAPELDQPVTLSARLDLADSPMADASIQASIRHPDGHRETVALAGDTTKSFTWTPNQPGLYGIDVTAESYTLEGSPIARTAFLAFEKQPAARKGGLNLLLITALSGGGLCWGRRLRRLVMRQANALISRSINHWLSRMLP